MANRQVIVAMSGGIDSLMAAILLKKSGRYQVSAVHLKLFAYNSQESDIEGLKDTCRGLDIPLEVVDFEEEFRRSVVDYFCREYRFGRTPNPCTTCNKEIKFGFLLNKVLTGGFDYLATGHYARVEYSPHRYHLLRGRDPSKDQSYFLYRLGQKELKHLILPLGNLFKSEVIVKAHRLSIKANGKEDSQDICFVRDNDYRAFLAGCIPLEEGDIIDTAGNTLGKHRGLSLYTVGQRQKLGLSSGKRLYVLKIDTQSNRIVVGSKKELLNHKLIARDMTWVSGVPPMDEGNITARIRYGTEEASVRLRNKDSGMEVTFDRAQSAIAPGQDVVFYRGEEVLGGGIIERANRENEK